MAGLAALLLTLAVLSGEAHLASSSDESCTTSSSSVEAINAEVGDRSLLQTRSSHSSKMKRTAKDELPEDIYALGLEVFGSDAALDEVVAKSTLLHIKYAGVKVDLRIREKDNAAIRLGGKDEEGNEYGLETLAEVRKSKTDMVNMIDLGGNYGVVTIAVYNKLPGKVRTVVVEPVGDTYFFMCWNFALNKVPILSKDEFLKDPKSPGVVALNGGVTDKQNEEILMCADPGWSMNAKVVSKFEPGWDAFTKTGCDCTKSSCTKVPGLTAEDLFHGYFVDAPIHLLKMDCEGCEFQFLPSLTKYTSRIKRLVGELHAPEENLIDIACEHDNGMYLTKVCKLSETEWASSLPLECKGARKKCRFAN